MKKLVVLIAVLLLAACVPEFVEPQKNATMKPAPGVVVPNATLERVIPTPVTNVWQARGPALIQWGYDEEGHLILVNSSKKTVVLTYLDGKLARIDDGVKPVTLTYDQDRLIAARKGVKQWAFTYNSRGNLVMMENAEKLHVAHDSKGRLSSVSRDSGASTELEYDDLNRTRRMYRFNIKTEMGYDSEGRLKLMSRDDDHLVIAYWRYDLLSSLSGTMYGLKETVNYGPSDITLISDVEQNVFTSENAELPERRFHAFNTFLFCTRFRKLPVLFDGQSWVLFHEYMKGTINEYILTSFVCDALP